MATTAPIEVHYKQKWRLISLLLAIGLLLFGSTLLLRFHNFLNKPAETNVIIGWVCIGLGLILLFLARKLFINSAAFVIDDTGFVDKTEYSSLGFIPWKDVKEIKRIKYNGKKMVGVFVSHPEKYIQNAPPSKSRLMSHHYEACQTPIVLSSKGLSYDHYTLLSALQRMYNISKGN